MPKCRGSEVVRKCKSRQKVVTCNNLPFTLERFECNLLACNTCPLLACVCLLGSSVYLKYTSRPALFCAKSASAVLFIEGAVVAEMTTYDVYVHHLYNFACFMITLVQTEATFVTYMLTQRLHVMQREISMA
uniref:Uncharacterized protein n=1 Tax=Rhipicephalus zambeziensis TaxID=60191 RepID=A0A224Y8C5_9ACAR